MATMLVAFLVVLGLFSYQSLGVDLFPNVDLPVVTITTQLRGASPEEVEAQITKPLEEAVNTAAGVDELRSTSLEGISIVTATFVLERKTSDAVQDVRDKVAAMLSRLPEGTEPPVITRFDTDAIPVATLVVSGTKTLKELTEYADKVIRPELQAVNGVGQVALVGGQKRAINIWLDAGKLASYGLTVPRVKAALQSQNVEIPSGRIQRSTSEQGLRTMARVEAVEEFNRLVVANLNGRSITFGDLGHAEDGNEEPRSLSRYDGQNAVALVIQKQSGTNTVAVVDKIKGRLATLQAQLPPGLEVQRVRDISAFIRRSIGEVKLHLVLGGILTAIIVLLFMGSWRSTLIAAVAIPTSLIATFTVMRSMGFTLNNMTLLGLVLAVGIVIDDAIVVLENIYRHMDEFKKPPLQAAIDGTREIMLPVLATTFSLVVIFLPIAFMSGRVGRFFNSFGITVAVAILFSLLVSVTLTPMLCSIFLKHRGEGHDEGTWLNRVVHKGYARLVRFAMARKALMVAVALFCVLLTFPFFKLVGKDFLPQDDRGEFNIAIQTPPGTALEGSDRILRDIEGKIGKLPHVSHLLTTIGNTGNGNEDVTQASLYVGLEDAEKRQLNQFQIMGLARKALADFPELRTAVQPISDIQQGGAAGSYQFNFALQGPDLGKLDEITAKLMARMRAEKGFVDTNTSTVQRKPEVQVRLNRAKAADLGVSANDIAASLRTLVAGEKVGKFREGAEQFDVWLRLRPEDRDREAALYQLEVPSAKGGSVKLANLVTLRDDTGPAQIDRLNNQRQITIVSNLDGLPLGTAIEQVGRFVKEADLPPGYAPMALGRAKVFAETGLNFAMAFLLSLIFMYMILAAQFESFLHPVTIMLSLPLSIPFALMSLVGLGETLNLYSVIGLFMLFGIVKKNGILQVDYTNTLRATGMDRDEAIFKANLVRLRPILMTTVTLIAGMTPIALGTGAGAASRASMAKVIIGGQALSLVITLLIVPVAYALFDDAQGFLKGALPLGIREKKTWAYAMAGGAGGLGAWLMIGLMGVLGDLPVVVQGFGTFLALGGLASFGLGVVLQRFDRKSPEEVTE